MQLLEGDRKIAQRDHLPVQGGTDFRTRQPQQRVEISLLVEMFRGRVVDISPSNILVEISGQESKIEAFIELMRPYGIVELARTGRIALVRGTPGQGDIL